MLSLQTLTAAGPLASKLDAKNLVVAPIPGTPLSSVCEASDTSDHHVWGDPGNRTIQIQHVADSTNSVDPVLGTCRHTVALSEIVDLVATSVSKHLNHARTVVAPAVQDLAERVSASIDEILRSNLSQLNIVVYRLPAPVYNPAFVESFQRSKDSSVQDEQVSLGLPASADAEQITSWMQTGQVDFDADVQAYLNCLGTAQLEVIYRDLFTKAGRAESLWKFFNDPEFGIDYAVVGFAIARKLWDNPPEGTETTLAEYESKMSWLRNQCALRLNYEIERADVDDRNGLIVRGYTRDTVTVNAKPYQEWLDAGGEHSVLFGNVLSASPVLTCAQLQERAGEYKHIWDRYCLLQKTVEANKKFSLAKDVVRAEFQAVLANATHDDIPMQERVFVVDQFNKALAITTEAEMHDVYQWILRLLCSSVYHKTDAFRILNGINEVKKNSPDVDVAEAAAVSALEYIAYWVSTQFKVIPAIR